MRILANCAILARQRTQAVLFARDYIMSKSSYYPVSQTDTNEVVVPLQEHKSVAFKVLAVVAVISSLRNAFWMFRSAQSESQVVTYRDVSRYAGLERDVVLPYVC